jgi:uncharacterized protein (DUF1800 family)
MRKLRALPVAVLLLAACLPVVSAFRKPAADNALHFPYRAAGWTEREAAAQLLSRFTYGARPEDIDSVLSMGMEQWFLRQLDAQEPDPELDQYLQHYDALSLSNAEVCRLYPSGNIVRSMAVRDSAISKDSIGQAVNKKAFDEQLKAYMAAHGIKPDQELYRQFVQHNILRAVYSRNQLQAVMTRFWFNHFNVSLFKGECASFIPAYERESIAAFALGHFDSLLLATAQSPAMLFYLDNATSVAADKPKPATDVIQQMGTMNAADTVPPPVKAKTPPAAPPKGLNENYARELMELHTLGVDGGYTQEDVTQAARILTGWTIYPFADMGVAALYKGAVARVGEDKLAEKGYLRRGDFLFVANKHDVQPKEVLGHHFDGGKDASAAYGEGLELLQMLAHHPATARFICRKLAAHFVCDNPPRALTDQMARSFLASNGDIRQVLITMVSSRIFWDKKYANAKTKSPFEYAVSAVRVLHADITDGDVLSAWITKMGERCYYYPAPTGFPDRAAFWINTGTLMSRINFAMKLSAGKLAGVQPDAGGYTTAATGQDTAAAAAALCNSLLPGRNTGLLRSEILPLFRDAAFMKSVQGTIALASPTPPPVKTDVGAPGDMMLMSAVPDSTTVAAAPVTKTEAAPLPALPAAIAGLILASPAFQQR